MSGAVPVDHVIDVETPHLEGSFTSQNDLYSTFLFHLRRDLCFAPPPCHLSLRRVWHCGRDQPWCDFGDSWGLQGLSKEEGMAAS